MGTLAVVQKLKNAGQDFEWYPTTDAQLQTIVDDIKAIQENFDLTNRYSDPVRFLDVGAGDGRALKTFKAAFEDEEKRQSVNCYAIEKATIHTDSYFGEGITLLGTEFTEINFISKSCNVAFVNPPYSEFSLWLSTLIKQLTFNLLYAVVPERWVNCPVIAEAIQLRGVIATVIDESDFLNAERAARAKVNLIRFSFVNVDESDEDDKRAQFRRDRGYKKSLSYDQTDAFGLFLENELGLKKTYSQTTQKFSEYYEAERVKKSMHTEGSESYAVAETKGVLWALLEGYERDLANTLAQYKRIASVEPELLAELGVEHDKLLESVKDKLFGYRNVYWKVLFDNLDAISSRLIGKHKTDLLNKLNSNALDFTYTNAVYVIKFAVDYANDLVEESITDTFKMLTSKDSISKYYKSNEKVFSDNWRHNRETNGSKYLLDYRFIFSSWGNFDKYKSRGLSDSAEVFINDLAVVFGLLGYSGIYNDVCAGSGKGSIYGMDTKGNCVELLNVKFYQNGNRHLKFNQAAMLRFNVTASRLLGWVRSKEELQTELDCDSEVAAEVWNVKDTLALTPIVALALACPRADNLDMAA